MHQSPSDIYLIANDSRLMVIDYGLMPTENHRMTSYRHPKPSARISGEYYAKEKRKLSMSRVHAVHQIAEQTTKTD